MDTHAGQSPEASPQPLLSVIIPVYNVEPYLRRCLDSVCGQSYRHLEIICVDDGSTDGSLSILREYEAKDARVRVVTQPNSRQARARNVALDMARGEWVTGVDSDDYMQPDAYRRAMAHATAGVDAVCFGMKVEAESGLEGRVADVYRFSNFKYEGLRELDAKCISGIAWYFVNKLYRRSVIEAHGLRFDESNCGCEDMRFHMCFCACARKAYFLREELYVYALRQGSTCHSVSQAELRVRSYVSCFDGVLAAFREQRGLEASLPMLRLLLSVMFRDSAPWAFRCGMALECRRELLRVAAKYGLQQLPSLAAELSELAEQLRWAQRAVDVLSACATVQPPAACADGAEGTPWQHVALPVDEVCAPSALELLRELRGAASGTRPLCVHVVAEGLVSATCARFEALSAPCFCVRVQLVDSAALRRLPPLAESGAYLPYLKMALPLLLPSVGRVLVLSPTLSLAGALPDWGSLSMEGMPVAALLQDGAGGASVLLLDLEALRAERGMESWLAACFFQPRCLPDAEADSFHLAFGGKVASLPAELWQGVFLPSGSAACSCLPMDGGELWVGLPQDAERAEAWSSYALPLEYLVLQRGYILRRYWGCRLAAALLAGRRCRRYAERSRHYRELLERIRVFRAGIRRRLPC